MSNNNRPRNVIAYPDNPGWREQLIHDLAVACRHHLILTWKDRGILVNFYNFMTLRLKEAEDRSTRKGYYNHQATAFVHDLATIITFFEISPPTAFRGMIYRPHPDSGVYNYYVKDIFPDEDEDEDNGNAPLSSNGGPPTPPQI